MSQTPKGLKALPRSTLSIRTAPETRQALEAYAEAKGVTLSMATSTVLNEWLRTHGWIEGKGRKPFGPATDAVDAMDEAIEGDRARRKGGRGASTGKRLASFKETGEEVPQEEWERFEAAPKKPDRA